MLDALLSALSWFGQFSDPLAWLVIAAFTLGAVLDVADHGDVARTVTVAAWGIFALFWFSQIYHFAFEQKSIVEGIGTVAAVPASLYVGLLLARGRDSLFVLSRAIAAMGLVFLPFETIGFLQQWLIETVAGQTAVLMQLLGYHPTLIPWPEAAQRVADLGGSVPADRHHAYRNTFLFVQDGYPITYTILIACTGIGSLAIFAGLIAAVEAPLERKLRALAVSIPIIYALNLVRNVFIGLTFGHQYLQVFPEVVMGLFATNDPHKVSYFVADRILSQFTSVIALVVITVLVVRELPEVLTVVDDVLFVFTGREYDLRTELGFSQVRTDGDGAVDPDGDR